MNLHYLAGFFDAKGNITAGRNKKGYYWVRVFINLPWDGTKILDEFQRLFGGKVYPRSFARLKSGYVVGNVWIIADRPKMKAMLTTMLPLLQHKAGMAKLALAIVDCMDKLGDYWGQEKPEGLQIRLAELVGELGKYQGGSRET